MDYELLRSAKDVATRLCFFKPIVLISFQYLLPFAAVIGVAL